MPKKAWDATINDLSKYRISRTEQEARHQRMISPNAAAARRDLERTQRRQSLATSGLDALGPDETKEALRELDAVEAELQRLAHDARRGPAPTVAPMRLSVAPITLDAPPADTAASRCETPPTPALDAPPLHQQWRSASWAPRALPDACMSDDDGDVGALPAPRPVVDLDEEIAQFRRRTEERLAEFAPEERSYLETTVPRATFGAEPTAAAPPLATAIREVRLEVAPKRRSPTAPHAAAVTARGSHSLPPWRPANGRFRPDAPLARQSLDAPPTAEDASCPSTTSSAACMQAGPRSPDALGLSRLQHACAELHTQLAEYEAARGEGSAEVAPEGGGEAAGRAARRAAGAVRGPNGPIAAFAPATSFSGCNAQLVELTTRLVTHLQRADAEMREQARLRAVAEEQREHAQDALDRSKDETVAELAAVRREFRLAKESHEAQLATLSAQLNSLRAASETRAVTELAATAAAASHAVAEAEEAVAGGAAETNAAAPRPAPTTAPTTAPSLFSPLRVAPSWAPSVAEPAPPAGWREARLRTTPTSPSPAVNATLVPTPSTPPPPAPWARGRNDASPTTALDASPTTALDASPGEAPHWAKDPYVSEVASREAAAAEEEAAANAKPLVSRYKRMPLPSRVPLGAPGGLPSAAMPPVTRCVVMGAAMGTVRGAAAAARADDLATGAESGASVTPPPRPLFAAEGSHTTASVNDRALATALAPVLDRVADAECAARSNEARSAALLQAYYDEIAGRSHSKPPTKPAPNSALGMPAPKPTAVAAMTGPAGMGRRAAPAAARPLRHAIVPTQLVFSSDAEEEPRPQRATPVATTTH